MRRNVSPTICRARFDLDVRSWNVSYAYALLEWRRDWESIFHRDWSSMEDDSFFFAYDSDVDMEGRRCCLLIIW